MGTAVWPTRRIRVTGAASSSWKGGAITDTRSYASTGPPVRSAVGRPCGVRVPNSTGGAQKPPAFARPVEEPSPAVLTGGYGCWCREAPARWDTDDGRESTPEHHRQGT